MKCAVVLILCFVVADIFGQTYANPIVYLDSDTIDWENLHIKPTSIDSMRVEHKTERGEVHIKPKQSLTFLTLDMILKKYTDIDDLIGQVIYIVDDELIEDESKIKIDKSYFIDVEVKRLEKVNYINERHRRLILVDIHLLDERPKPVIRIRGVEGLQTRN